MVLSSLGAPDSEEWPEGGDRSAGMVLPQVRELPARRSLKSIAQAEPGAFLQSALPKHSSAAVAQIFSDMLQVNPARRPTARQALQYPFFQVLYHSIIAPAEFRLQFGLAMQADELKRATPRGAVCVAPAPAKGTPRSSRSRACGLGGSAGGKERKRVQRLRGIERWRAASARFSALAYHT